jgi:hypothetical protein
MRLQEFSTRNKAIVASYELQEAMSFVDFSQYLNYFADVVKCLNTGISCADKLSICSSMRR